MRFDSEQHLSDWQSAGMFPAIHDRLVQLIATETQERAFLDVGCCYGLLGLRVSKVIKGSFVIGVEASREKILAAREAGVMLPMVDLTINRENLFELFELVANNNIRAMICRRVLPELWGNDIEGGQEFARQCAMYGIKEIYIEGRVETAQATNALNTLEKEVALFGDLYKTGRVEARTVLLTRTR